MEFSRRTFSTLAGTAVLGLALGGAGAGSPAADPRRVAPTGPPPPVPRADGGRHSVEFDRYSMVVDGRRLVIWSGELHLFRLPSPSLWRDMLQKLRAYGYNTVSVCVAWNYHSPAPGRHDFSGVRDLDLFLRMASEAGLYVILRPGPYLGAAAAIGAGGGDGADPAAGSDPAASAGAGTDAGTGKDAGGSVGGGIDAGGLPGWLTSVAGHARSTDPAYLKHVDAWLSAVDEIAVRYLYTRGGGTVLLYQVETEGGKPVSAAYLAHLHDRIRRDGIDVPLFHRGGPTATPAFVQGTGNGSGSGSSGSGSGSASGSGTTASSANPPADAVSLRRLHLTALADGVTFHHDRSAVGGAAWGWLPASPAPPADGSGAASFDVSRNATARAVPMHQLGHLLRSVPDLAKMRKAAEVRADVRSGGPVTVRHLTNSDTGAHAYLVRNDGAKEARVELPVDAASLPVTLPAGDARLLLARVRVPQRELRFTTAQLMWAGAVGDQDVAVFTGRRGETVEAVVACPEEPVPARLDEEPAWAYDGELVHVTVPLGAGGLSRVLIQQGGSDRPLLLLFADEETSVRLWPYETPDGDVLVYGPALLRKAEVGGHTLRLTGDIRELTGLETWGPKQVTKVTWNGRALAVRGSSSGGLSLAGQLPEVAGVPLPGLSGWRRKDENPESDPRFDDTGWTVADRTTSYSVTPVPAGGPVLFADDYGCHYGDVWYRGRFKDARDVEEVALSCRAGAAQGLLMAWLDGEPLGAHELPASGESTARFPVPDGLRTGGAHVLSVLVRPMGHGQDDAADDAHKAARGLVKVSFTGADPAVEWRIQKAPAPDPVRGPLNNGGLSGEREGLHLPGLDDRDWTAVDSLRDDRGRQGVSWYRTTFRLDVSPSLDPAVGLALSDEDPGRAYRVQVFLNGWNLGQYRGGQGGGTGDGSGASAGEGVFALPNGLLRTDGMPNTLALAVLSHGTTPSGPDRVRLRLLGIAQGGVPVTPVSSPGARR